MKKHRVLASILCVCLACGFTACAGKGASKFPNKAMQLIVPYSAGGGTDTVARSIADEVKKVSGQAVAVINQTGGGGAVGMQNGAKAKADGYEQTMTTVELLTLPMMKLASFTYKDFIPVALLNEDPSCITVRADSKWKTIQEFIADAKENELKVGNSGFGSVWYLASAAFSQKTGAKLNYIPFDGAKPAVTSLLGGHIDCVTVSPAEVMQQVKAGQLRILAVMSDKRFDQLPDVPTLKESGVDISIGTWRGVCVPKGTPEEAVKSLEDIYAKAAQSSSFKEVLRKLNMGYAYTDGQGFKIFIEKQAEQFEQLMPLIEKNKS